MTRTPAHRATRPPRSHRGASLIEVLVAVLILSLGLLGLAGMQLRALRANISSAQRTQGVIMSQYILDLMRVDRMSALQGNYDTAGGLNTPLCAVPEAAMPSPAIGLSAQTEVRQWLTSLKANLGRPGDATTCAAIACLLQGVCTVNLRWDDSPSGGLPNQTLSITTQL